MVESNSEAFEEYKSNQSVLATLVFRKQITLKCSHQFELCACKFDAKPQFAGNVIKIILQIPRRVGVGSSKQADVADDDDDNLVPLPSRKCF